MKIRFLGFLIFILLVGTPSFSQEITSKKTDDIDKADENSAGRVKVYQDSWVDSIVKQHVEYNRHQNGIEGYRVQIFFDAGNNSLNQANSVAGQFQLLYPGDTAYISFSEPYYKVRVGDFRTKLDAEGFLQEVLGDYPNAFVIRDKINFPKLD